MKIMVWIPSSLYGQWELFSYPKVSSAYSITMAVHGYPDSLDPLHNYIFPFGFTNLNISFFQHSKKIQMTMVFLSWALKQSTLAPGTLKNLCTLYSMNHNFLIGSRIKNMIMFIEWLNKNSLGSKMNIIQHADANVT